MTIAVYKVTMRIGNLLFLEIGVVTKNFAEKDDVHLFIFASIFVPFCLLLLTHFDDYFLQDSSNKVLFEK
ncbi:hypothetical protein QJ48_13550 [Paenibacillus sp. A3]|nr:hypothetical protein QJ48_13550 [Paenibacillus sp. A3]